MNFEDEFRELLARLVRIGKKRGEDVQSLRSRALRSTAASLVDLTVNNGGDMNEVGSTLETMLSVINEFLPSSRSWREDEAEIASEIMKITFERAKEKHPGFTNAELRKSYKHFESQILPERLKGHPDAEYLHERLAAECAALDQFLPLDEERN